MSGVWAVVLVFAASIATLFWSLWVWSVIHLLSERRRGVEPTRVQIEAREWPAAVAIGFTGLAVVVWLAG